jgi:hypothetical protein
MDFFLVFKVTHSNPLQKFFKFEFFWGMLRRLFRRSAQPSSRTFQQDLGTVLRAQRKKKKEN